MTAPDRDEVEEALERGRKLQEPRPQRDITVEVTIADRGQLAREKWTADLDDEGQMHGLETEVLAKIRTATGG